MCVTARRGENMKKIITSAVLCAAMATAVSTFGVQPVSATYPLIDKNGNIFKAHNGPLVDKLGKKDSKAWENALKKCK